LGLRGTATDYEEARGKMKNEEKGKEKTDILYMCVLVMGSD
jgi:hypothetical protein